jgi:AmmeMemoRadiSam system protein A
MSTEMASPGNISTQDGQWLVRLARATLAQALDSPLPADQQRALDDQLQRPVYHTRAGAFVTLTQKGSLRGCIGTLTAQETLIHNIRENALNAAFRDPRFSPLTQKEFTHTTIEVSVLSPPEPLAYSDPDDLLTRIQPGVDGIILRKGAASATFLPQVWKQLPRRRDFLSHLCLKAGLPAQAWREGDLSVETYRVQKFTEASPD